jgi:hypothetical protein
MADIPAIYDRIEAILTSCTTPAFRVLVGDPAGLPLGDRIAVFWWVGESEKDETYGNVMVWETYAIRLYWVLRPERPTQKALDIEMQTASRAVQALFRADSSLGGLVEDSKLTLAARADQLATSYQIVTFELTVWESEEEAITA